MGTGGHDRGASLLSAISAVSGESEMQLTIESGPSKAQDRFGFLIDVSPTTHEVTRGNGCAAAIGLSTDLACCGYLVLYPCSLHLWTVLTLQQG
jgi:hypothetical protein